MLVTYAAATAATGPSGSGLSLMRAERHETQKHRAAAATVSIEASAHLSHLAGDDKGLPGVTVTDGTAPAGDTTVGGNSAVVPAAADDKVVTTKPVAPSGFKFMMRSILKSSCLQVRADGRTFELADCDRSNAKQQFTAEGFTALHHQPAEGSKIKLFNGKLLCFTGTDAVEADTEECGIMAPAYVKMHDNGCFRLVWKKNSCEFDTSCIHDDACVAPPQGADKQDLSISSNFCSGSGKEGLWVNPLDDQHKDQVTCD